MTKCQDSCDPEQTPVAKPLAKQPYPQLIEDTPFQHGVDVGHRHQEEEEQLRVFQKVMPYGLFDFAIGTRHAVGQGHEYPDQTCRNQHGLGFRQVNPFFQHDQQVSDDKNRYCNVAHWVGYKIHGPVGVCPHQSGRQRQHSR